MWENQEKEKWLVIYIGGIGSNAGRICLPEGKRSADECGISIAASGISIQ
jgi:hypothetical protein